MKNGVFFKERELYFFFIFEPLGGFDPAMAQTKSVTSAITELHCSIIVAEISTNRSKLPLGLILVNSAVIVKKSDNALTTRTGIILHKKTKTKTKTKIILKKCPTSGERLIR